MFEYGYVYLVMSLEQLRKIDEYRFFIRRLDEELKLSSAPFFAKASGTCYELSMLRDVDFCFKYEPGTEIRFELYAVKVKSGDNQRDSLGKLFKVLNRNRGKTDDVVMVYDWSHVIGKTELKKMNRKQIVMSGFQINWWINWFNKGRYWMFSNPELRIDTQKLVDKLC